MGGGGQGGYGARLALALAVAGASALSGCAREAANGRPWVHKLRFTGVKQVKQSDIKGKIATQQSPWLPWLPKKYLDNPFVVNLDKERIAAYYHARGFFSAEATAQISPHGTKAADVTFNVSEGLPTRIDHLQIQGLELLKADAPHVQRAITFREGQRFQHTDYLIAKVNLLDRLKARGYAFAKVTGEVTINRDRRLADVSFTIEPGPRAVFGSVRVTGSQRTNPKYLLKHIYIPRGEVFQPDLLEAAQGSLYDLGMFSAVKVDYAPDPQHPEVADVVINVDEGKFNELRIGGGFGLEPLRTDAHVQVDYTRHNFLGGLRSLRLTGKPGFAVLPAFWSVASGGDRCGYYDNCGPTLDLEAALTQPDPIGHDSRLKLSLDYNLGVEYAYQFHGPSLRLGLTRSFWVNRVRLGVSYNLQYLFFFSVLQPFSGAVQSDPQLAEVFYGFTNPYRLGYFQEDAALDLRDHQIDATKGGYLSLQIQEGGAYAGGAFTYEKLVPDVRGYLPLGKRVVLAGRVQYGRMFSQENTATPLTQRFYLGGPNSHRGFSYNRLAPQVCSLHMVNAPLNTATPVACDAPVGQNFEVLRLPIGGDEMILAQAELRIRLVKIYGMWLNMAGFVDGGDVAAPSATQQVCQNPQGQAKVACQQGFSESIDYAHLHWAAGGGLRLHTVIGTIRADLGVRLNRLADNETLSNGTVVGNPDPGQRFTFHLSIGEAF